MNNESKVLDLLKDLVSSIRKREIDKAKKVYTFLLKEKVALTKQIILQIYEFGETFKVYKDGSYFLNRVNQILKKEQNEFLYLIKLEIMQNCYPNKEEAIQVCNNALKIFPENPEFMNIKANILGEFGEKEKQEEALFLINSALGLDSHNTTFMRNKALLLNEMGRKREALEIIEKALGYEPENAILREDKSYIEFEKDLFKIDEFVEYTRGKFSKLEDELKNVKVEFVTIAGLFVAILTFVSKMVTFDYTLLKEMNYFEIFWYQLSVNSAWLIAIAGILLFVLFFNIRYKK